MVWLKRDALSPAPARSRHPVHKHPSAALASTAATEVLEKLRRLIEQGRIPAGARLPPERALAAEHGVGRPAVREAIKTLCGLGLLESRRGSGTYVKSAPPALQLAPALAGAPAEPNLVDLLEVRKILEPRAAWLAATRATEEQLRDIESARRRLELHDSDWKMTARLDYDLHAAICRAANNPALRRIYEYLMSVLLRSDQEKVRFPPDVQAMRRGHRAVVEAILKRQPDAAERAMTEHLNTVGMNFIREASR